MTEASIPEGGYPEIPIVAPYEYDAVPTFDTGLVDMQSESAIEEVIQFYVATLIPQLACAPDGALSPHPQEGWIKSESSPRTIVTCRVDGELRGAWIIKDNGIYYPCATIDFIAPIFRALWDETIKHFDYVWGDTSNPVIMAFAQKAVRTPRSPNSPEVNDRRLEWRRP
jgi:hypothetical protein